MARMRNRNRGRLGYRPQSAPKARKWWFQGVFPNADSDTYHFGYTAGLWRTYRHPELIVIGPSIEVMFGIVDDIVENHIVRGERYEDGQRIRFFDDGAELAFRTVPNHHDVYPMAVTGREYGNYDFPVLQVVLPDKHNKMPWDEGCDPTYVATQQALVSGD